MGGQVARKLSERAEAEVDCVRVYHGKMDSMTESLDGPPTRIVRLCQRALECNEPYIFVAGRWVLGGAEQSAASLALAARMGLFVILAEECVTICPSGVELRHHRPRPWENE